MKVLLAWLLISLSLLGTVSAVICWVTDQSLDALMGWVMDRRFVLGVVFTMSVVVSLVIALLCCSNGHA